MHHLRKQVAYIKGLTEGMELSAGSKEGRIIKNIVDVMEDFSEQIMELQQRQDEIESYLESVDEDLYDLEEEIYEEDMDEMEMEDDNFDYVEAECPGCNELVCFEPEIADEEDTIEVTCPNCDDVVYVNDGTYDIDYDEDELDIEFDHQHTESMPNKFGSKRTMDI
ncbi:ribosomal protein S27E [Desulfitispora alkaliphila]|uniref:CD1247 N-terminal domain-containing protein n=1 Tax=Desulfitispora alkaliphila TaxID=622674 RepID=UPI003D1BCA55